MCGVNGYDQKYDFIWIVQWKDNDTMSGERLREEYRKLGLPIDEP